MPAFDPVRDAVLNSPNTQSRPLPSRINIDFPSSLPRSFPSPTSSDSVPSVPSPLTRRATDLSVLLNSDPLTPHDALNTPLFTPTAPRAPTNLSHLLHPDSPPVQIEDQLTQVPPLRRRSAPTPADFSKDTNTFTPATKDTVSNPPSPSKPSSDSHPLPSAHTPTILHRVVQSRPQPSPPPSATPTTPFSLSLPTSSSSFIPSPNLPPRPPPPSSSSPVAVRLPPKPVSTLPSTMPPPPIPAPNQPSHRPRSITPSASLPPKPTQPLPPPPPPYVRSTVPYAPRNRRTPAGSVLIPLTPAEWERYQNYPGGIGSQLLKSHNRKRKLRERDDTDDNDRPSKRFSDVGLVVDHYNARPEVGVIQRNESPIIGLKSFNNWVKSVLITQFAHPVLAASSNVAYLQTPNQRGRGERMAGMGGGTRVSGKVLDMGCGKGGDLTKWAKARIKEYFGVDIAAISVDQARDRYTSLRPPKFKANFYATDCYSSSLSSSLSPHLAQEVLPPNGAEFDVVSMQFCMHYAFESEVKAKTMLGNVSRWLKKGGMFVGTIPNAAQLLERLESLPSNADNLSFGNSVYKIRFEDRHNRPIYGDRYSFYLKDAVDDVPEYIVHWDHFVKLAAEYSLYPVFMKEFHQVFMDNQEHKEFGPLLEKMKVVDSKGESQMDEDQWEAANIYIAFALEKR